MSSWVWEPTPNYIESANVTRLIQACGCESLSELRTRAVADIGWYWDAVVKDLALPFRVPYTEVLDSSRGPQWTTWFVNGHCNITHACVDRWRNDPERADSIALLGESEDGEIREFSYSQLAEQVDRVARALLARGIGRGDVVGVFMPMVCEAVIAAYAIAKIGAIYLPIFSGFAAGAIAARLQDAGAKALITADGAWRRGKKAPLKPTCDEALASCPTVATLIVLRRLGVDCDMCDGRDLDWDEWLGAVTDESPLAAADTGAEDIFMLGYTSGTTGKPKGAVLVHGGFLVKIASEVAYQTDVHPGERLFWVTDMGWIMGPFAMVGAHANGATMVMFEGSPDFPNPGRVWEMVERHSIEVLGISPTLIRSLRTKGDRWVTDHNLQSLRILGSTGEPWNPEPYRWLSTVVGSGRLPIINLSGGTEVAACFLSPYPVEPIKECSLGGPSLGMDMDVFSPRGESLEDEMGELVCKQPWPSMTRGIWKDPERYLSSYWSTFAGVWRHGDWAKIDRDDRWFLLGRSDEAINVAGKRVGPAEVESILVAHEGVAEAATVGVPDEVKGEAIWCFWVPVDPAGEDVSGELSDLIADKLGRPFKPARVVLVPDLPKTRSAKILRRAVRAAALGVDFGDLSSAENPEAVVGIRQALDRLEVPAESIT